ncbi:MAG: Holliday junction branch migration protein RuvA, partial [Acidimicrobiales bacterium]
GQGLGAGGSGSGPGRGSVPGRRRGDGPGEGRGSGLVIGSLRGVVIEVLDGPALLVEVGGVGYRVAVPTTALAGVVLGAPLFLHVHTHVREDAIVLFGFPDREGLACFESLLGAHGVGPALALAIISALGPSALRRAVLGGDADALTLVPGVGRKTAARLLLELAPRMEALGSIAGAVAGAGGGAPGPGAGDGSDPSGRALAEVRSALAGLGYGPEEIRAAVAALPEDGGVEDLVRAALRELAGSR